MQKGNSVSPSDFPSECGMNTRERATRYARARAKKCTRTRVDRSTNAQKNACGGKYQKGQNHDFGAFKYFQNLRNENFSQKFPKNT